MSATTNKNKSFNAAAAQELLDIGAPGIGALYAANNISALQAPRPDVLELRESLDMLGESGLEGPDIAGILSACPELSNKAQAVSAVQTLTILQNTFELRRYDLRRIARSEPTILLKSDLTETLQALNDMKLSGKNLKLTLLRWPKILTYSTTTILNLRGFLSHPQVGFKEDQIGSLVRKAPWLLDGNLETQMGPVVRFLTKLQVRRIETVIRAYPQVLLTDVKTELLPRIEFLMKYLNLSLADASSVIGAFPLVLGLDVETRMRPAVMYLSNDRLGIAPESVSKIFRSFPSLLGLDTVEHFDVSVSFLQEIGVENIGRFVLRLPPVLGYDVEINLRPKWEYLTDTLGLSTYDITRFPAYFSYPLDKVIMPRASYLSDRCNRKASIWGLNTILTLSDDAFAEKVALTSKEEYAAYRASFAKQLERAKVEEAAEAANTEVQQQQDGSRGVDSLQQSVPWLQQEAQSKDRGQQGSMEAPMASTSTNRLNQPMDGQAISTDTNPLSMTPASAVGGGGAVEALSLTENNNNASSSILFYPI